MQDFGYPQTTSTEGLKSFVFNEPVVVDAARIPSLGPAAMFIVSLFPSQWLIDAGSNEIESSFYEGLLVWYHQRDIIGVACVVMAARVQACTWNCSHKIRGS